MIIAHSPTRQPDGDRIVIRDLGHEFVVHNESFLPDGTPAYSWGNYFSKKGGERAALANAWLRFEERSRALIGVPPEGEPFDKEDDDEKKNHARFEGQRREAFEEGSCMSAGIDPGDDPDSVGY